MGLACHWSSAEEAPLLGGGSARKEDTDSLPLLSRIMDRFSSAEEYYSTYSEPVDSDASSECGYETAYEGGRRGSEGEGWARRGDSPIDGGSEPVAAADVESLRAAIGEKIDFRPTLHILKALNDCIWCTNVFTTERLMGRNPKRRHSIGFTGFYKEPENLYPDEDIKKELEYIEYLLHMLLKGLLLMVEKKDYGPKHDAIKDLFDKASSLLDASNPWPADRYSQASKRYNEKATDIDKLLHNGQCGLCFDKKDLNVMFRTIVMEVETANNISNCRRETGVEPQPAAEGMHSVRVGSDGASEVVARMEACAEALESLRCLIHEEEEEEEDGGEARPWTLPILRHSMDWNRALSAMCARVKQKGRLVSYFLGLAWREGGEQLEAVAREFAEEAEGERVGMRGAVGVRRAPGHGGWDSSRMLRGSWSPCSTSLDQLLFEKEVWRLRAVELNGGDPLAHLCGVSLPLDYGAFKNDTRATYYGIKRKNMLSIALQTADMSEKIHKSLPKKIFDLMMMLLSMSLYFSDMVSDLIMAGDHYSQGNKAYSYLTLIFVFAPFLSETLSKFILKSLGWDKEYGQLHWRDVFNFNDFKIIKWMVCSVNYSLRSMKNYQKLAPCYSELHSHRCDKGRRQFTAVGGGGGEEEADSSHIHHVFYSMLAWNERFTLQTKLAESLNESAPQLLLQLVIVFKQFVSGKPIGFKTWFCIVTSTLSLSWAMHLSHFNRHYHSGGRVLNNSYEWKARILEFVGNCFVYGSRLLSISLVASIDGVWFVLGALLYLTAIYLVMVLASGRKEIYKTLHRYKTTIFWPLHRLFTVPYRIGVWRMDSLDHLLYYSEIVFLALLTPFVLPQGADQGVAWVATGAILSLAGVGAALLFAFKKCIHPYGYVCENR